MMVLLWNDVFTLSLLVLAQPFLGRATDADLTKFPDNFYIGAASAAYQIEGAWNVSGKGESIWDYLLHHKPDLVNGENGDVACDSYHKYKADIKALKEIGLTHYRFSISWPRILPSGYAHNINKPGVTYYHDLIDELISSNIIPMVTLYHWDLPQNLQDLGGWANPLMAEYFKEFARVVFTEYGNKVKWWITINEPYQITQGYGDGKFAPKIYQYGVADYLVAKILLIGHAKVYHLYDKEFKPTQNGKVGITLSSYFFFPLADTTEDKAAAKRSLEWELGIFAHPIFSMNGDWPQVVKERVAKNSKAEGRRESRLPAFTAEEIKEIQGSHDFFGLNHYTSRFSTSGLTGTNPSWARDCGSVTSSDSSWKSAYSAWIKVVPKGFRAILNYIKTEYNNPPLLVTENGYSSDSEIEDTARVEYHHDYMQEMLKAIHEDNCNVIGYTVWSLTDNFSWQGGYSKRFGLVHIDYTDENLSRKVKKAGEFFKRCMAEKKLVTCS